LRIFGNIKKNISECLRISRIFEDFGKIFGRFLRRFLEIFESI